MKIVFAGTPEFAAQAMRAIYEAGHEIVLALTQPDRRAGRGMHLQASPVKTFALEKNIPLLQPETLKRNSIDEYKKLQTEETYQQLTQTDFDAMVVVAYGLILPPEILTISERAGRHGSFNIHASLLPRWRGAAPIQRAIEAGDRKTGVCIMQMDAGLDTGDIVLVEELEIAADETSGTLHNSLAKLGAKLIVQSLSQLQDGMSLVRTPQSNIGMIYAEKILKSEAVIDWNLDAQQIAARIRAFNPSPGATTSLNGLAFKIWNAHIAKESPDNLAKPGEIFGLSDQGIFVQCGSGGIEVLEMQKAGGKKMDAKTCLQTLESPKKPLRFKSGAE